MSHILYDREAHDITRNIHRFYRVWTQTNLFKTLLVCTQWGRVGTSGRVKEYPVVDETEAQKVVSVLIKRRGGAMKRLGVGYDEVKVSHHHAY